jgi:hypothetical protein
MPQSDELVDREDAVGDVCAGCGRVPGAGHVPGCSAEAAARAGVGLGPEGLTPDTPPCGRPGCFDRTHHTHESLGAHSRSLTGPPGACPECGVPQSPLNQRGNDDHRPGCHAIVAGCRCMSDLGGSHPGHGVICACGWKGSRNQHPIHAAAERTAAKLPQPPSPVVDDWVEEHEVVVMVRKAPSGRMRFYVSCRGRWGDRACRTFKVGPTGAGVYTDSSVEAIQWATEHANGMAWPRG